MGSVTFKPLEIDLSEEIEKALRKVGGSCSEDIASNSPIGYTGEYASGWDWVITDGGESVTIANMGDHNSLAHLLELGHKTKSGGYVAPQEHIRPAYNRNKQLYLNELKNINIKAK